MESNPEEFQGFLGGRTYQIQNTRWHPFLNTIDEFGVTLFTKQEIAAVKRKLHSIQGETFTNAVMQELLK
jgi:predicted nucleotide-binding protein (sugar kinase/HSP70/actin superfamily)